MKDPRCFFLDRWFSNSVFSGLSAALHDSREAALSKEGAFMSQLVLALLDRQRNGDLFNPGLYDFYAFCQRNISRSHSQILQDLWVLHMLAEKKGGYFVEFGACDGIALSNTYLLEREYGWSGILAEPDGVWHEALANSRRCRIDRRCVAARSGERISFAHVPAMPELSRIGNIVPDDVHERNGNRAAYEEVDVETVSLMDLLAFHNAPAEIDYLSIDTEGSEYVILEGFDFSAYRFRLLTVEHAGEKSKREALLRLLERHGYCRWRPELSRWDDWYVLQK